MRNFYLSFKFCALIINLSVLPRQIPLQITVFGKEHLRNVLSNSRRRVNKKSLTWWCVFKTPWIYLDKTSWKCVEDVLKTYGQDKYIGLDQVVLKTSSEDVRLRRTYLSWSRRLQDILKMSSKGEDERRLHEDECLLGIGTTCFDKCFLFYLISERDYCYPGIFFQSPCSCFLWNKRFERLLFWNISVTAIGNINTKY